MSAFILFLDHLADVLRPTSGLAGGLRPGDAHATRFHDKPHVVDGKDTADMNSVDSTYTGPSRVADQQPNTDRAGGSLASVVQSTAGGGAGEQQQDSANSVIDGHIGQEPKSGEGEPPKRRLTYRDQIENPNAYYRELFGIYGDVSRPKKPTIGRRVRKFLGWHTSTGFPR
jgi:hypothetical protein